MNKREKYMKTKWGRLGIYGMLLLIVICAMLAIDKAVSKGKTSSAIPDLGQDTINVAVIYGPQSYRVIESADGLDSIAGINYQLLKMLEDSLHTTVVMHPVIDRDDALDKVRYGQYDILASLPADNYLKKHFLTTEHVSLDRLVLLQMRGKDGKLRANSALDLQNDTVHVEKGSAATRRLENLQKEIGGTINIVEEEGLSEEYLAMKVATGEWRYTVVNEKIAEDMKRTYPDLDYSTPVSFTQFQVWVLPLGQDSLLRRVNTFLKSALTEE